MSLQCKCPTLTNPLSPIAIVNGSIEILQEGYTIIAKNNKILIYSTEEYEKQQEKEQKQDLRLP